MNEISADHVCGLLLLPGSNEYNNNNMLLLARRKISHLPPDKIIAKLPQLFKYKPPPNETLRSHDKTRLMEKI